MSKSPIGSAGHEDRRLDVLQHAAVPATHHLAEGAPDGAPVLFCPALATTLEVWEPQVRDLADTVRAVRYDLPGHGGSDPAVPGATMADLGRQALSVLDEHGIEKATVAGLSLGGMVALWLALHAPHRVTALVVCAGAAQLPPPAGWLERAALVRRAGLEPVAQAILDRWLDLEDPEVLPGAEARCRSMLAATTREGFASCSEAVAGFDVRDQLSEVSVPTTIVAASLDEATTLADARELAGQIPGAQLIILPGRSHLLTLARPAAITAALQQALVGPL